MLEQIIDKIALYVGVLCGGYFLSDLIHCCHFLCWCPPHILFLTVFVLPIEKIHLAGEEMFANTVIHQTF